MSKLDYFKAKIEATISPMDFMQAAKAEPDKFLLVDVRNAPPHIMKEKVAGATQIPLMQLADYWKTTTMFLNYREESRRGNQWHFLLKPLNKNSAPPHPERIRRTACPAAE